MYTPFTMIALFTCVLWLGACDKTPTTPPTPRANVPALIEFGATAGSFASPVPLADSVFSLANFTRTDRAQRLANSTMSAA